MGKPQNRPVGGQGHNLFQVLQSLRNDVELLKDRVYTVQSNAGCTTSRCDCIERNLKDQYDRVRAMKRLVAMLILVNIVAAALVAAWLWLILHK